MESDLQKPREELAIELFDLKEKEQESYLSEARKEAIRRRIAVIAFELGYSQETAA